jgi:hypothetical protein
MAEQLLGQAAGRDPGGRLPGRRALEDVAGVREPVLQHAGQVGMTGPGLGQDLLGRAGVRRHLLGPLGPLGVGDLDRDRGAERAPVPQPPDQGDLVLLEAHPGAAAVAEAAAGQLVLDVGGAEGQAGRHPFDHDDDRATVRFAGGQEAQHDRKPTVRSDRPF